jgi:hypothetical protein
MRARTCVWLSALSYISPAPHLAISCVWSPLYALFQRENSKHLEKYCVFKVLTFEHLKKTACLINNVELMVFENIENTASRKDWFFTNLIFKRLKNTDFEVLIFCLCDLCLLSDVLLRHFVKVVEVWPQCERPLWIALSRENSGIFISWNLKNPNCVPLTSGFPLNSTKLIKDAFPSQRRLKHLLFQTFHSPRKISFSFWRPCMYGCVVEFSQVLNSLLACCSSFCVHVCFPAFGRLFV